MAQGTTTNLSLKTQQADDQLPEVVVKDNFETIDSYATGVKLTNKSGSGVVAGNVVIVATGTDSAFTKTTTANSNKVLGVVQETIADNGTGIVKMAGTTSVLVTAATARGDWLVTSTTSGQASPVAGANPPNGAFAIALTSTGGAGSVTARLYETSVTQTIALPASAAPTPTTDGVAEWDSDDNRIVVGDGAAQTTFYSGQTTGWVLVGKDTTERSDASGAAANAPVITLNASVPAASPMKIVFNYRKGAGAASAALIGFLLNATVVADASAAGVSIAATSAANQAEDGMCEIIIAPREANYTSGLTGAYICRVSATGASATNGTAAVGLSAVMPTAAITTVTMRLNSVAAAQTVAVKNVYIYALGVNYA